MCLDNPDELEIYGNYQSGWKKSLIVQIKKCSSLQGNDQCKPEQEIDQALKDAAFVVYSKQVSFDYNEYGEESIKTSYKTE